MKSIYQYARWLHIYISSALFSLLLFFCISGVLLNHLSWINGAKQDGSLHARLPDKLITQLPHFRDEPLQFAQQLIPILKTRYNLQRSRSIEWDADFAELLLDYPLPAGYALVTVSFNTGSYRIDYQTSGVLQILNDLHKGRNTGTVWSLVIDASAILMLIFALTGIIILVQNRKKRLPSLLTLLLGTISPLMIYFLFVPRLTGI